MKIIPKKLEPGATIALISPSARLNNTIPHRVARAADFLHSLNYRVHIIYTTVPKICTLRQSILHRVAEIHAAFEDPNIGAIVCTIGGSVCNELLPHLDYALIKANAKIFCGFSDITLLHYALYTHADLCTFYGPTAITQWGEYPSPLTFTTAHFFKALTSTKVIGQFPFSRECTSESLDWFTRKDITRARTLQRNPGWRWVRPGKATGLIFGGCLPSILRLGATEYDLPTYKNIILLLELPEGEKHGPYSLQTAKTQTCDLANRGVFKQIAGLVIGRCYAYTDAMTTSWNDYILQITENLDFPILSGVDVGHSDPMVTVPLGVRAEMDSEAGIWAMVAPGVQ